MYEHARDLLYTHTYSLLWLHFKTLRLKFVHSLFSHLANGEKRETWWMALWSMVFTRLADINSSHRRVHWSTGWVWTWWKADGLHPWVCVCVCVCVNTPIGTYTCFVMQVAQNKWHDSCKRLTCAGHMRDHRCVTIPLAASVTPSPSDDGSPRTTTLRAPRAVFCEGDRAVNMELHLKSRHRKEDLKKGTRTRNQSSIPSWFC